MGSSIAQVAATAGHEVLMSDVTEADARCGADRIAASLRRAVERGRTEAREAEAIVSRIRIAPDRSALAEAGLVIEAAPEDEGVKREVLEELDRLCPPSTVFASNTSSLSIGRLAEVLREPGRLVGMHFFNPAPVMKLVEIVRSPKSTDRAVRQAVALALRWKKTAVEVKDTPGFVVNRVARPYYLEAFRMVEEEDLEIEAIDEALEAEGFPMGPGRLADLIGIDVNYAVSRSLYEGFARHPRFEPPPLQERLISEGHLGRKSGRGFYDYEREASGSGAGRPGGRAPVERAAIVLRVVSSIVNEAFLAVEEGICDETGVDTAMKLGTNYPRGPFDWAKAIGPDRIVSELRRLRAVRPRRYEPAPSLCRAAGGGR